MPIPNGFNPAAASMLSGGYFVYEDLASKTTPQNILAATETVISNDAAGPLTNLDYAPVGFSSIWDEINDQFDFNQLGPADTVEIRISMNVVTTIPNQQVDINLVAGVGGATEFSTVFVSASPKSSGSFPVNRYNGIFMGSPPVQTNPAEFRILSEAACTISNVLWYVHITRKSV